MSEIKQILDSGTRETFDSGAQRDIIENKGLPSLLPCDAMINYLSLKLEHKEILPLIELFKFWRGDKEKDHLMECLNCLIDNSEKNTPINFPFKTLINLTIHFENGAKKYKSRNWEMGMPLSVYFNSAFRHIVKYIAEQMDEEHLVAAIWNIVCLQQTKIWIENKYLPEKLNDIPNPKPPISTKISNAHSEK